MADVVVVVTVTRGSDGSWVMVNGQHKLMALAQARKSA